MEAPRFSPGLGHDADADMIKETGDHSEQAVVSGEASMGLGSNDIAVGGGGGGGGVGLGQDSGGGIQPIESDTPLLLGGLFPINGSPQFSLERMEPVGGRGLKRSKRVSGSATCRQGSSGANMGMPVGLELDGSLAMGLKRRREVDSTTRTMESVPVKKVCSSPSVGGVGEHTRHSQ
ncbi:hypothetical protein ACFX11_032505 [Malus domestica]